GIELPVHPATLRIEAALDQRGRSLPLEELSAIMCRVVPKMTEEEKASVYLTEMENAWPWFKIRDEVVRFDEQKSRWFLAGRSIANYECR
ncbi:hypothetical protein EK21DRAFT_59018, partial [Setomelanomma holmii]